MARINIGEGLWSVIRGYLNSMFTELYADTAKLQTENFRIQERSGRLCLDKKLTPLGFAGVENTDWEQINDLG